MYVINLHTFMYLAILFSEMTCLYWIYTLTIVYITFGGRVANHGWCTRLCIKQSRWESWPTTLHSALGEDALLALCFSPPRCINGYQQILCWGRFTLQWTSIPPTVGEKKTPSHFMLVRTKNKHWPDGPLGSYADLSLTCTGMYSCKDM